MAGSTIRFWRSSGHSQPVLEAILRECGAGEKFEELNELRKEAKKPGWWSTRRMPPWLKEYVVSEGALHRLLAEPDLALLQLCHLAASAQLPTVSLRVLPFSAGLHPSVSGAFTVLEFAPGVCAPMAYQEDAVYGDLVDDQDVVRELSGVYDQLHAQALDEGKSLEMISELIAQ